MIVKIVVTASIEAVDEEAPALPDDKLASAVLEAIENAVKGGEEMGFEHELDGQTSILITRVEPFDKGGGEPAPDPNDFCDECGEPYPPEARDMLRPWHKKSCSLYDPVDVQEEKDRKNGLLGPEYPGEQF